jgi:hypothetical protein
VRISRRIFLGAGFAATLLGLNPLAPTTEAVAPALLVLGAFVSIVSSFMHSDGGLSAILSNIRELQAETVGLLQSVISGLGQIQSLLINLPNVIQEQLVLHAADQVKERMTQASDDLAFCDAQRAKGISHKDVLERVVNTCTETASRFRTVPYGVGGTAAICAPLLAAMDARARTLLNKRGEVRDAMNIYYLPWMDAIQSTGQDGSLANALVATGVRYKYDEDHLPGFKNLGADFLKRTLSLDVKDVVISQEAICGSTTINCSAFGHAFPDHMAECFADLANPNFGDRLSAISLTVHGQAIQSPIANSVSDDFGPKLVQLTSTLDTRADC